MKCAVKQKYVFFFFQREISPEETLFRHLHGQWTSSNTHISEESETLLAYLEHLSNSTEPLTLDKEVQTSNTPQFEGEWWGRVFSPQGKLIERVETSSGSKAHCAVQTENKFSLEFWNLVMSNTTIPAELIFGS
jgi:hypothetical protein